MVLTGLELTAQCDRYADIYMDQLSNIPPIIPPTIVAVGECGRTKCTCTMRNLERDAQPFTAPQLALRTHDPMMMRSFRSSFRPWVHKPTNLPGEVAEAAGPPEPERGATSLSAWRYARQTLEADGRMGRTLCHGSALNEGCTDNETGLRG